jgi:hypothetical protein
LEYDSTEQDPLHVGEQPPFAALQTVLVAADARVSYASFLLWLPLSMLVHHPSFDRRFVSCLCGRLVAADAVPF